MQFASGKKSTVDQSFRKIQLSPLKSLTERNKSHIILPTPKTDYHLSKLPDLGLKRDGSNASMEIPYGHKYPFHRRGNTNAYLGLPTIQKQ